MEEEDDDDGDDEYGRFNRKDPHPLPINPFTLYTPHKT